METIVMRYRTADVAAEEIRAGGEPLGNNLVALGKGEIDSRDTDSGASVYSAESRDASVLVVGVILRGLGQTSDWRGSEHRAVYACIRIEQSFDGAQAPRFVRDDCPELIRTETSSGQAEDEVSLRELGLE